MLVHELILQGHVSAMAFQFPKQVSYGQLQSECSKYRNYFYHQGIRSGQNVGLFSRNSCEYVYCYMALASLGAVVVPLNFQLTSREIAYVVKDSQMNHLVTMEKLDLAAELAQYAYTASLEQHVIADFASSTTTLPEAPSLELDANDPCVIIYTSGTTGNPKGAILTHKNLVSNVRAFGEALPPTSASDNVLCVLPMYHCFAWTCAVLYPLMAGASITILEGFSPKETIAAIKEAGVTVVFGVPPMYNYLSRIGATEELSGVRIFVSGGAALPQKIAEQFQQKYGNPILEGYGLSEASPVVALNPAEKTKYCSIGRALPGLNVKVVNTKGESLPPGEVGELVVQGDSVMQGYFNLPLESSRALRNGWLHTGDLAYQDIDGYFFIVDRLKDMIIINGENVYPREIEELLYGYPGIVEAAVIGLPDELRGEAVCAYVALEDGKTFNRKEIRAFLQPLLASFKMPRDIVQVDALPKNKTGKIMKRLLREQIASGRNNAQTG